MDGGQTMRKHTKAYRLWRKRVRAEFRAPIPSILFGTCSCNVRTSFSTHQPLRQKWISPAWYKYIREHPESGWGITPDQALEPYHKGFFAHARASRSFKKW